MSELTMRDTTATLATARLKAQPRRGIPPWLRWGSWGPTLITFVIAALLWQVVAWTNPYVLPTLEAIGTSLVDDAGMYWSNFLVTLLEVVVGASAGILAGFLLTVIMAEFQIIERAVMPLVIIVTVTPIVAIAPALVVAFGFGMVPKFIVTGLVVFFPMLVNSLAGLRDVDQKALDVFKTLHASRWEIFRELRFPGSMPYVFAGRCGALRTRRAPHRPAARGGRRGGRRVR
uniref:ABC transporter permease n=1 Tax=Microbacterium sp. BF1 TaxID=2821146 RepID=UPI00211A4EBF